MMRCCALSIVVFFAGTQLAASQDQVPWFPLDANPTFEMRNEIALEPYPLVKVWLRHNHPEPIETPLGPVVRDIIRYEFNCRLHTVRFIYWAKINPAGKRVFLLQDRYASADPMQGAVTKEAFAKACAAAVAP